MKKTIARMGMAFALACMLAWAPAVANAAVRTVAGVVNFYAGDTVQLNNGDSYFIGDAPAYDSSGQQVSPLEIRVGRKITLYFDGARVTSVLVHAVHQAE